MLLYFNKLSALFDRSGKSRILGLFGLICIVTLLEMCSLGLVYPFLEVLRDPSSVTKFPILQKTLSPFLKGDPTQFFLTLGAVLAIAYIIKNLVLLLFIYFQNRFTRNQIALLSYKMLKGYLKLPYTFHLQKNTAALLRNIENSVVIVFKRGLISLIYIILDGMITVGLLSVLLLVDPLSTLAVLAVLGGGLSFFYWVMKIPISRWSEKEHTLVAEVYKWIHQSIGAIKEMKVLARERFFSDRFSKAVVDRAQPQIAYGTVKQSPRVFFEILLILIMVLVFWITYAQGKSADSALSILAMFAVVSLRLVPSINRIAASILDLKGSVPALEAIHKDYEMISRNQALARQVNPYEQSFSFVKNIYFENVTFSYPGSKEPAVKNINFEIRCGESVGIVGPTGAGKTTLIDILIGLLTPSKGKLLVDGHDIYSGILGWQGQVGYVPQKIFLIDDTLRRNIALGLKDEEIDDEKIEKSIHCAYLTQFLSSLPEGLDTRVGERGVRLSGGESQRVGIARALYHNPEILVLDEATSALDNETEHEIAKSIDEIAQSRTLVIVAHRLSTVRKCDFLIFMRDGVIVDKGQFDEIRTRNPDFRRQVQLGIFTENP